MGKAPAADAAGKAADWRRGITGEKTMWKPVKFLGIILFLLLCSVQDIREKKLSVRMLVLAGILSFILSVVFDRIPWDERIGNMLPGMLALVLAFLTREQIGYGDAACLIVLGNVVSARILSGAVMTGLLLLDVWSAVLFLRKRVNRGTTIPFLPFLTVGMLCWLIIQKGESL